ncbi:psbP-like protein 1, chloroplastic [Rutidosis leptorrhynchoides]|uniref:psbP-like protein 1, chloroplastic n=1 Tax=Rutidosis leptorrhynchoides TaxID=125765 RepID=UPI003A99EDB2
MSEDFLSSNLVVYIEREIAKMFDSESVIDEFKDLKGRRAEFVQAPSLAPSTSLQDKTGRRQMMATGITVAPWFLLSYQKSAVSEALIKKVLAPPSQKTKLLTATEHEVDGIVYYTFEFVAQAPNFTRHALSTIAIGNGKFYTWTTGANERRWGKMKDKLNVVADSFKLFNV